MSYDYLFVDLNTDANSLRELDEQKLRRPLYSVEVLKSKLEFIFPGLEWRDEGDEVYFGSFSCGDTPIEVWIHSKTTGFVVKISRIVHTEAVDIGRRLSLSVFNAQTGEKLL